MKTLYAFDFDGTLAPIIDNPSDARMSARVADLLEKLNTISGVAILSGRSVKDLRKILPFEPRYLIGNHGLEGAHSESEMQTFRNLAEKWKESLSVLPENAWLEDKTYSLTIHYRENQHDLLKRVSALDGATILEGKNTLNIIPSAGMNKGQALDLIMKQNHIHFGFFIGDDKTDETVFAYKHSRLLTVKVGLSPDTYAKYYLNSQSEVEKLLEVILSYQKHLT